MDGYIGPDDDECGSSPTISELRPLAAKRYYVLFKTGQNDSPNNANKGWVEKETTNEYMYYKGFKIFSICLVAATRKFIIALSIVLAPNISSNIMQRFWNIGMANMLNKYRRPDRDGWCMQARCCETYSSTQQIHQYPT